MWIQRGPIASLYSVEREYYRRESRDFVEEEEKKGEQKP